MENTKPQQSENIIGIIKPLDVTKTPKPQNPKYHSIHELMNLLV